MNGSQTPPFALELTGQVAYRISAFVASSQPLNDCTVASVADAALRPRDRQCIAAGHLPFHAARSRAMRVIPRRPS